MFESLGFELGLRCAVCGDSAGEKMHLGQLSLERELTAKNAATNNKDLLGQCHDGLRGN